MAYASAHADMASSSRGGCRISGDDSSSYNFGKQGGVTNGAAWYSLKGGSYSHSTGSFDGTRTRVAIDHL